MSKKKENSANGQMEDLRQELVAHFKGLRETLRMWWVSAMETKELSLGITKEEMEIESGNIYDTCVECLETGGFSQAEKYAIRIAQRGVLQGMGAGQVLNGMLTLRDIYSRSLFNRYQKNQDLLSKALDIYEPVANQILSIVSMAFIDEREKTVKKQQEAILELSTPILKLRDSLLILPIIGILDSVRTRQLTEQLLNAIRAHRARGVVIDITGVPAVDSKVANHLLQTVEASRLMGAEVIITGISPEIAQTIVTIGVDLSAVKTKSDLQSGVEAMDLMLGYKVIDTGLKQDITLM